MEPHCPSRELDSRPGRRRAGSGGVVVSLAARSGLVRRGPGARRRRSAGGAGRAGRAAHRSRFHRRRAVRPGLCHGSGPFVADGQPAAPGRGRAGRDRRQRGPHAGSPRPPVAHALAGRPVGRNHSSAATRPAGRLRARRQLLPRTQPGPAAARVCPARLRAASLENRRFAAVRPGDEPHALRQLGARSSETPHGAGGPARAGGAAFPLPAGHGAAARLQRLGLERRPDRIRQAAAGQRPAPSLDAARHLAPGSSARAGTERGRGRAARNSRRHYRP